MAEAGGIDLSAIPPLLQAAVAAGVTAAAFWVALRGKMGGAALSEPRTNADDIVDKMRVEQREALLAIKDAVIALSAQDAKRMELLDKQTTNSVRIVTAQEAIVEMMKKDKEEEAKMERDGRLLAGFVEKMERRLEKDRDRDREDGRRRPNHDE